MDDPRLERAYADPVAYIRLRDPRWTVRDRGARAGPGPAARALNDHLAHSDPYRVVRLLLFQHGADPTGIARPEDWARTITAHGATPDFLGMDPARFPHDICNAGCTEKKDQKGTDAVLIVSHGSPITKLGTSSC